MKEQLSVRTSLLLLVLVVMGVYYPAIFSPFNSVDDPGTINYLLNNDFGLRDIFAPGGTYYRPILLLTFIADKDLWGLQQSFMHLENVLLHLLNVLMVFAVARRALSRSALRSPLPALAAALLFAVHPINTESVNWISGRTDPLACFFVLLSAFLMLRRPASPINSLCAALALLIACLAKETAVFFLPAALLLPFFVEGEGDRGTLRQTAVEQWQHLLIFCAAGAGFFAFRALGSRHSDAGFARVLSHVGGAQSAGTAVNLRLPLKAAGFYLKKLVEPFPLNFGIIHVSDLYLPVGVLLCLVLLWLVSRRTLAAWFFISAACISCSALMIPLLNLTWTPLAERYMYIPCSFFVVGVLLAFEGGRYPERVQRFAAAALALVLVIAVYGTVSRTLLWQDNLALFQDTFRKSPGFAPAQNEIATALDARGDKRGAAQVLSSMQISASVINYQYGLMTKAAALGQNGDLDGALALLQQALKDPGKHEVDISRRILTLYQMKVDNGTAKSADIYPESVRILSRLYQVTGDPFYLYRLGVIHLAQKQRTLARGCFERAAKEFPPRSVYQGLSLKLAKKTADREKQLKELN
jgi:protein O-mannosyl-transferase